MIRLVYSLLLFLLLLPVTGYMLWRSRKDPGYRRRFSERFALSSVPEQARGGVVIHAVSVGEVVAATPLINRILEQYPHLPVVVTCTTPTGSARIRQTFGERVFHCYLPFDTPGMVSRWLDKWQPRLLIVLETELWLNLLYSCRKRQIPTVVVNARLSARSARGYRHFYWLSRQLLENISLLLAQNPATARRFKALGLSGESRVTGNLKFEMAVPAKVQQLAASISPYLSGRQIWVAGSTHAGEDEILLQAFLQLRQQLPQLLLILVPRHPERFGAVEALIQQANLPYITRSSGKLPDTQTAILLGDSMGELLAWYSLADVVFIGGSLIPRGGHNPLEAICFGKPVQSGPQVFNFTEAYKQLEERQAVNWVTDIASLVANCLMLFTDTAKCQEQGLRAQQFYQQQQGATSRTLAAIQQLTGVDMTYRQQQLDNQVFWWQPACFSDMKADYFRPAYWQQQQAVTGSSSGRNTAWFIQYHEQQMVLRHYYRGGLIGKLLKDQFWLQPVAKSRAMQEFRLLQWMSEQGLPVPKPCAARYVRSGLVYRADLLIERIPDSQDLATILSRSRALTAEEWQQTGKAIAVMHSKGVYHSDLNCHNILLDTQGKIWLIDFDKCERRADGEWQQQNLARLQRSLLKEQSKNPQFYWQPADWQQLLQGYQQQMDNR
ncbi:lipid IV(A) 3-deoxy-D-manno-octulosonic acid transferase [Chromatiaceae bacterium AAb-1]|nr:lipid IV(A) 3-deoxy-D-manno-octulosonic acid transferase [Chromatiaceae bacterium AAb-1]